MRASEDLSIRILSSDEFPRTWTVLRQGVAEAVAPGMVAGFWSAQDPDRVHLAAIGHRRSEPSELPMLPDTVFDLASVSKVFATATLAAVLVERGWLRWETSLGSIFPRFAGSEIRLSHLLSHTAGFVAWQPFYEKLRERFSAKPVWCYSIADRQAAMRELLLQQKPERPVGERAVYSDISFLLLGFALEEATQLPLDRAVAELLWKPLGLGSAFYRRVTATPDEARLEQVAATERCPWRGGVLQGQVHDDNCWAMGGYSGHAGAFADARDVLFFGARLLGGFLSARTLSEAWTRVARPVGCDRTLGWDTPSGQEPAVGRFFSSRTVGHLGFTGTSLWIDPEAGLVVTLLTNRVHPSRENPRIKPYRSRFHDALRLDLNPQAG